MIKKQYFKTKSFCKVTFELKKQQVTDASVIYLVGEFNDWNTSDLAMTKLRSGNFKTTLNLEQGRKYQFRYLVDGVKWINDSEADKYVDNGIDTQQNSVLIL